MDKDFEKRLNNLVKNICEQNNYKGNYMDFREPIFVDPTMLEGTNEI